MLDEVTAIVDGYNAYDLNGGLLWFSLEGT